MLSTGKQKWNEMALIDGHQIQDIYLHIRTLLRKITKQHVKN